MSMRKNVTDNLLLVGDFERPLAIFYKIFKINTLNCKNSFKDYKQKTYQKKEQKNIVNQSTNIF